MFVPTANPGGGAGQSRAEERSKRMFKMRMLKMTIVMRRIFNDKLPVLLTYDSLVYKFYNNKNIFWGSSGD